MDPLVGIVLGVFAGAIAKLWSDARTAAKRCEAQHEKCQAINVDLQKNLAVLLDRTNRQ